ncbi:unnamed protein product [Cutaneotrichosporon oleaginosum]
MSRRNIRGGASPPHPDPPHQPPRHRPPQFVGFVGSVVPAALSRTPPQGRASGIPDALSLTFSTAGLVIA